MIKYCNGKHFCLICHKEFKCFGESSMHNPSQNMKGSGRCNGSYGQFCDNHDVDEYRQKHIELGELS